MSWLCIRSMNRPFAVGRTVLVCMWNRRFDYRMVLPQLVLPISQAVMSGTMPIQGATRKHGAPPLYRFFEVMQSEIFLSEWGWTDCCFQIRRWILRLMCNAIPASRIAQPPRIMVMDCQIEAAGSPVCGAQAIVVPVSLQCAYTMVSDVNGEPNWNRVPPIGSVYQPSNVCPSHVGCMGSDVDVEESRV